MALEIRIPSPSESGLIADRRLYLTREDVMVEEGSLEAATLLVGGAGALIPSDVATRLGLELVDGHIVQMLFRRSTTPGAAEEPAAPKAAPTRKK